jgi:hypothetical protein
MMKIYCFNGYFALGYDVGVIVHVANAVHSGLGFSSDGLWWAATRRRVGFVLVLLCFLRLSLHGALDFRNNTWKITVSLLLSNELEKKLTFWPHSNAEAFFESTLLTLASHVHVDLTIVAVFALVDSIFRDAAPEEAWKNAFNLVPR